MTGAAMISPAVMARSALRRTLGFLLLWIILADARPSALLPGIAAALIAATVSLRLLAPSPTRIHAVPLVGLAARFLIKSVIAGVDVARRALDPRLPINPGLLRYPVRLPPGAARNVFAMLASLSPGTVPIGPDDDDHLVVHCLDLHQPVADQLAREEDDLLRVVGRSAVHG
jgi:multicomponent Na+:H+ antiporter subunit E